VRPRPRVVPAARRLAPILLAAVFAGVPIAIPAPAAGVGALPDCRLDDVRTVPRGYDDWAITQVDWNLTLGRRYRPPDLVSVRDSGVAGSGYVRAVAIDDLRAMARAAEDNGTPLVSWSAYRGYRQQVELFNGYAGWTGSEYTNFDNAVTFSARPGHSEHQLGLTIDFVAVGDTGLTSNWDETPTGAWMAENAWKFGWLMSYPKGKKELTCYSFEPWHYRYVGRELAEKIHDSGLTTREYLWSNYTRVDGDCMATPPATLETPGKPRVCPLEEPAGSPGASGAPPPTGPVPSGSPGEGPPSMGPAPIPTGEPAPGGASALDAIPTPVLVGLAIALGLALAFALRGARGARPRR
jgi:zinc D-Ala-D-Ala carboxypeptidase